MPKVVTLVVGATYVNKVNNRCANFHSRATQPCLMLSCCPARENSTALMVIVCFCYRNKIMKLWCTKNLSA